jgi:hypothetical protein
MQILIYEEPQFTRTGAYFLKGNIWALWINREGAVHSYKGN